MTSRRRAPSGRIQVRTVADVREVMDPDAPPPLQFDFDGRPAPGRSPQRQKDDSIKQAIVRWLNEQL